MGCECAKQEESSGTHLLVYTVGTEKTFYQMVEDPAPCAWAVWESDHPQ